jgi:hypothetical protein
VGEAIVKRAASLVLLVATGLLVGCSSDNRDEKRIEVRVRMPLCAQSGECVTIGLPEAVASVRLNDAEVASARTGMDGIARMTVTVQGPAVVTVTSPLLADGPLEHHLLLGPTSRMTTVDFMGQASVRAG